MCFKVAYIGSIGEGVERLVQESEQLVVEKLVQSLLMLVVQLITLHQITD